MALITDPDQLSQGVEITIDTSGETFTLNTTGNLSADGVTGQALYSFLKEEWKADPTLMKFRFPMLAITPEQFEFGNNGSKFSDWRPADDSTRKLIRTAGWREYSIAGASLREYAGVISLGSIGATDQPYFQQEVDGAATNTTFLGAVNEAVQIFGDAANGNFDYRSNFKLFVREQAKLYASSDLASIGVTVMTYQVYRFPLANGSDIKISASDVEIDSTSDGTADVAPYDLMSIEYLDGIGFTVWADSIVYPANAVVQDAADGRWYITALGGTSSGTNTSNDTGVTDWTSYAGERQIGTSWYAYNVIVDGNSAVAENIYEYTKWSLRQTVDIDSGAGTVIGQTADDLTQFIGDTLRTAAGVYVDSYNSNDTNRIEFSDVSDGVRTFPFVSAGALLFNNNLQNDSAAEYWMYFKDAGGNQIDTASAIVVNDNSGTPISGTIGGSDSISFDFDYDGNTQGGRSQAQDAVVVVRAIGLDTGAYVEAEYTITRGVGLAFSLVSPLERNYANPS